ncbi:MAG: glycosyltransferase [Aquaticitalea sp.]
MAPKKINLTFVTANLFAGGAERIISFLAKEMDRDKFNITMVVFGFKKDVSYDIEGINTIFFDEIRVLNGTLKLFKFLAKHKPDVVLSVIAHVNTVVGYQSICFPNTKFIAREVNVLSVLETFMTRQHPILRFIYKQRFKFFDAVVCQSQDMLEDMNTHYKIRPDKLHVINNPITNGFEVKTSATSSLILKCITVGRLAKEKGHDRLLEALRKLSIPFHLTLIGSGPEMDNLFSLIKSLSLKDKITHIPFTNEVNRYLRQSDVYLQSSYVEGFPNAVIESCAVGTPVIAFKAPGGLNEIIVEGVNGYIAEDENEFLEYISQVYCNNTFVPQLVSDSVYSKFGKEKILKEYEDLIIKTNG